MNEDKEKLLTKISKEIYQTRPIIFKYIYPNIQKYINIKYSRLNLFEILNIIDTESIYTHFLAWLLNPQKNHIGTKPLRYFLKLVDKKFHFNIDKKISVKPEAPLNEKQNLFPDITIEGNNFICYIEIKIKSGEGFVKAKGRYYNKSKTQAYFYEGHKRYKMKKKFFVYITMNNKPGPHFNKINKTAWVHCTWLDIIEKVLGPLYESKRSQVEDILKIIIYNLQKLAIENLFIPVKEDEDKIIKFGEYPFLFFIYPKSKEICLQLSEDIRNEAANYISKKMNVQPIYSRSGKNIWIVKKYKKHQFKSKIIEFLKVVNAYKKENKNIIFKA